MRTRLSYHAFASRRPFQRGASEAASRSRKPISTQLCGPSSTLAQCRWLIYRANLSRRSRGAAQAASIDYPRHVYPHLEKEMILAAPIPLERLCRLAHVSRAGYYRRQDAAPVVDPPGPWSVWVYTPRDVRSKMEIPDYR